MAQKGEFVGIDVSKAMLDVRIWPGEQLFRLGNAPSGWAELVDRLKAHDIAAIGVEATGGYERGVLRALLDAGMPVRQVNPFRVRRFAQGCGILAKNDRIDAGVIAHFVAVVPQPKVERPRAVEALAELVTARRQLCDERTRARHQAAHATQPILKTLAEQRIDRLKRDIALLDKAIEEAAAAHDDLAAKQSLMRSVPGVGPVFAHSLLAMMPELGTLTSRQAAALLGVAPFDCDSGGFKGQRRIFGGRRKLRDVAYMAAVVATSHNPVLKAFYERLRSAGKRPKVAIVAVMRKLIVTLNAIIRNNQPWQPA